MKTTEAAPLKITLEIDAQRIADMMTGAIEGGANYWLHRAEFRPGTRYHEAGAYATEGASIAEFTFDDPAEDEGNGHGKKTIRLADIKAGLEKMAAYAPLHFAALMSEDDDAETADVFLQFVLFGESSYLAKSFTDDRKKAQERR